MKFSGRLISSRFAGRRGPYSGRPLSGSGGVAPPPVYNPAIFATVQNRQHISAPSSTGKNGQAFVVEHVVAGDFYRLIVRFPNYYMPGSEINTGNDLVISDCYVVLNNVVVQVTVGGQTTFTIPNGSAGINADPILYSAFGLATHIPRATSCHIKGIASGAAGFKVPSVSAYAPFSDMTGAQAVWFDSATTTVGNKNAAGVFTFTGGTTVAANQGYMPWVLGNPVNADQPAFIALSGSLGAGQADTTQGPYGRGQYQRTVQNGSQANPHPLCNMSVEGVRVDHYNNATKWRDNLQYVNLVMMDCGGNNILGGDSATLIDTKLATLRGIAKGAANRPLLQVGVGASTTTNDNYRTYNGQTITDYTAVGVSLNDKLQVRKDAGEFEEYDDCAVMRQDITPPSYKWVCAPAQDVNNYAVSFDGVHYSPTGYGLQAGTLRTKRDALIARL